MILVGIGPGNIKYASLEAIETIKNSKLVLAFSRLGKGLENIANVKYIQKLEDILDYDGDFTLAVSGDPLLYSAFDFLQRKGVKIDRIIPSISSFQYMMCKLKKSWNDALILSFHGREDELSKVKRNGITVIFTDSKYNPSFFSEALLNKGYKGKIYAGFNLSYEDEVIIEKNIGDSFDLISNLCILVVEACG
ncbi:MAG: precorrin-6y C5,15-methyltransferase (decarboxylating) subunit CbiE [Caloramator sp.]|nr:precorrin-6y C5,15-methyltransferase (decarboxylating) subunit CbiE [Caloramator sp.]